VVERRTADRLRGATRGAADDDAAGSQEPGDRPHKAKIDSYCLDFCVNENSFPQVTILGLKIREEVL
jgi:hypothetical protein